MIADQKPKINNRICLFSNLVCCTAHKGEKKINNHEKLFFETRLMIGCHKWTPIRMENSAMMNLKGVWMEKFLWLNRCYNNENDKI